LEVGFNRREMLRIGAAGATAAIISTAASSSVLQSLNGAPASDPLAPLAQPQPQAQILTPSAPAGIDPQLFARAKAALDRHQIYARDSIGIVDFSRPSSTGPIRPAITIRASTVSRFV
jgi:hypothetical protein